MKIVGAIALLIGVLGFIVTLSMDTTVATGEFGRRVNNIGLMNDKQNLLLLFSVISIIGAIFFGLSVNSQRRSVPTVQAEIEAASRERICPFCAEKIKFEALVCRYCQRDLTTAANGSPEHREMEAKAVPINSSEASCIKQLSELGCQVEKSGPSKWIILWKDGRTELYAYSLDELRAHTSKIMQRSSIGDNRVES